MALVVGETLPVDAADETRQRSWVSYWARGLERGREETQIVVEKRVSGATWSGMRLKACISTGGRQLVVEDLTSATVLRQQ